MPDVNVLVSAFHADAAQHDVCANWLERAVAGGEPVGLSDGVLTGTIRVMTHRRIFGDPAPVEVAVEQVELLRAASGTVRVLPSERFWPIFVDLCPVAGARGDLVADAAHAALAIDHHAIWITLDRDFTRFPNLSWRLPS
ncbi:MAG TPA: TA system VapC family ribonuclease toxin [Candidatus Nanopelagicales bacterium]|jgi:hypothetical protein